MSVIFFEVVDDGAPDLLAGIPPASEPMEDPRKDDFWQDIFLKAAETLGNAPPVRKRALGSYAEIPAMLDLPEELAPLKEIENLLYLCMARQEPNGAIPPPEPPVGGPHPFPVIADDTECLLVLAACHFVRVSGEEGFLTEPVGGVSVVRRLSGAMEYLWNERMIESVGLLGNLPVDGRQSVGLQVNALACIALRELLDQPGLSLPERRVWVSRLVNLSIAIRAQLWDKGTLRHQPRRVTPSGLVALGDNCIHPYATALAIRAGFLNEVEKRTALADLKEALRDCGARSVGFSHLLPHADSPDALLAPVTRPLEWTAVTARIAEILARNGFRGEALSMLRAGAGLCAEAGVVAEAFETDGRPVGGPSAHAAAALLAAFEAIAPSPAPLRVRRPPPSSPGASSLPQNLTGLKAPTPPLRLPVIARLKPGVKGLKQLAGILVDPNPRGAELELPLAVPSDTQVEMELWVSQGGVLASHLLRGSLSRPRSNRDSTRFTLAVAFEMRGSALKAWTEFLAQQGVQ